MSEITEDVINCNLTVDELAHMNKGVPPYIIRQLKEGKIKQLPKIDQRKIKVPITTDIEEVMLKNKERVLSRTERAKITTPVKPKPIEQKVDEVKTDEVIKQVRNRPSRHDKRFPPNIREFIAQIPGRPSRVAKLLDVSYTLIEMCRDEYNIEPEIYFKKNGNVKPHINTRDIPLIRSIRNKERHEQ